MAFWEAGKSAMTEMHSTMMGAQASALYALVSPVPKWANPAGLSVATVEWFMEKPVMMGIEQTAMAAVSDVE